jgi:CarD family transcriptional regulator
VGSILEVAEVFKCLLLQQKDKPLSFREKKMLDRSRHMLLTEVSTSRCVATGDAAEIVRRALGKAGLPMPEAL